MKNKILVICETNGDGARERMSLITAQVRSAGTWWHHIRGVWLLHDSDSADEWAQRLNPCLTPGDKLLVLVLEVRESQGLLPKRAWDWLANNFLAE